MNILINYISIKCAMKNVKCIFLFIDRSIQNENIYCIYNILNKY